MTASERFEKAGYSERGFLSECRELAADINEKNPFGSEGDYHRVEMLIAMAEEWFARAAIAKAEGRE